MTKQKFDIFEVIKEIEGIQVEFFDNLKDYEIKQISPYILMKWMSGVKDSKQLININNTINDKIFSMSKHPKLMYKVMMAAATRKDKRVTWIKRPSKKSSNIIVSVIMEYYGCSSRHASDYLQILDDSEILDMAESIGLEKDRFTKLKKELNGK